MRIEGPGQGIRRVCGAAVQYWGRVSGTRSATGVSIVTALPTVGAVTSVLAFAYPMHGLPLRAKSGSGTAI
jgi:hypothetical protein